MTPTKENPMAFDNVDQEKQYANALIEEQTAEKQKDLESLIQQTKDTKKNLRKLAKQFVCNHDFKLKQEMDHDFYKCKKCKFQFVVGLQERQSNA
jgi:hypothetical protein